jgi:hypothetical protein
MEHACKRDSKQREAVERHLLEHRGQADPARAAGASRSGKPTSSTCDGKVVEFWNACADQYAFDELIG